MGLTMKKLKHLRKVHGHTKSMEEPVPNTQTASGPLQIGEDAHAPRARTSFEATAESTMMHNMEGVLSTLAARERGVLRMRYGLDDGQPKTLEEIGVIYEVTRERIRQIEAKALLKLRVSDGTHCLKEHMDFVLSGGEKFREMRRVLIKPRTDG